MGLRNKDLLSIHDLTVGEVATILDVAKKLKRKQKAGEPHQYLKGKTLAMLFSKASTRTRTSFEVGFWQLGGHPIYLSDSASQIGRGEPIRDTARVLSRMVDGIMIRTFSHESVVELAKYASVPVINGLTDLLHPCQALTDMFTIQEKMEVLKGRKLVYVGDGNNMAHSLMYACAKVGMSMVCASPKGYQPDPKVLAEAQEDASHTGCTITVEEDLFKAAKVRTYCTPTCGPAWARKQSVIFALRHCIIIKLTKHCWMWLVRNASCCTACLPIVAKKLPRMCWKDRTPWCLTRLRTASTYKRPLWLS